MESDAFLYTDIETKAIKLENAFLDKGLIVNRVGSLLSAFFTDKEVTDYISALTANTTLYASYYSQMRAQGIYIAPSQFEAMFVSAAHSNDDIENTINAIKNVKII